MTFIDRAPATALARFGKYFKDGTLYKATEGASDGQGGFAEGAETAYPCKALATDYSDQRRVALGIPASDRQVLVLARSLAAIPEVGDTIEAVDMAGGGVLTRYEIIARTSDPAGACYELQAR